MDEHTLTDNERFIAAVWDYLCASKAPVSVKAKFRRLALSILDNTEAANLKHWQPQLEADEYGDS